MSRASRPQDPPAEGHSRLLVVGIQPHLPLVCTQPQPALLLYIHRITRCEFHEGGAFVYYAHGCVPTTGDRPWCVVGSQCIFVESSHKEVGTMMIIPILQMKRRPRERKKLPGSKCKTET